MRVLEVLLEENALGSVRPIEVMAHVPVSLLVPALIEQLKLPQSDSYSRRLAYRLCAASRGGIYVLPEDKSLAASGIKPGAKLALDCQVVHDLMPASMQNGQARYNHAFYSETTLADSDSFSEPGKHTSALLPDVKKERRWTRRAFLILGGAVLGAGAGTAYALYRASMGGTPAVRPTAAQTAIARPATPTIPTMAKEVFSFTQHTQTVRAVAWSPEGTMLASGADDAQLLVWNTAGAVHTQAQQSGPVRAIAWSADGQKIAAGALNAVTFLNALSGTILARSTHRHTADVTSLAWSIAHPLLMVSGALDKQAIVWNTETYRPQTIFTHHSSSVESVTWAADGEIIASSSHGGVVRVWNAINGQEIHGYYFDGATPLRASAFAPQGAQLAVGGDDGIVRLWEGTGCLQQKQSAFGSQCLDAPTRLRGHTSIVRTTAWSPDTRLLATGGDDGLLAIWYPAQRQAPLFTVHAAAPVQTLAWSPDGQHVAMGSGNTVAIWKLQ